MFGTQETSNPLAEQFDGCYQNIAVVEPISTVSLNMYRNIENLKCGEKNVAECDFMDSIVVALDMLHTRCGRHKYSKRIFLVTDASYSERNRKVEKAILDSAISKGVAVNVIGVEFSEEDQKQDKKPTPKQLNEQFLRNLCEKTGGVVVPTTQAIETLSEFRSKKVLQTTSFRGLLEIGSHLKIPVYAYKKTDETKLPSAKKKSKLAPAESEGKVVEQKTFYALDNPDEEVPEEKQVKAYKYGKNFIPFNKVDLKYLKLKTEKCMQVLGFTEGSKVPRMFLYPHLLTLFKGSHFMDDAACVVPKPDDPTAQLAFNSLVHALQEMDRVAIVRYVYRENADPKLAILAPHIGTDYECFFLNVLPCIEDLRQYPFRSFQHVQISTEQEQAAEDLIDAMDLMHAEKDPEPHESLKPSYTFHPIIQYFNDCLHHRALHPNDPIPPIDPLILKYCFPEKSDSSFYTALVKKAEDAIKQFSEKFTLTKVDQEQAKKGKKRKYWFASGEEKELSLDSYVTKENKEEVLAEAALNEPQAKRLKEDMPGDDMSFPDNNQRLGIGNIFNNKASTIGSVNPVKDFKEMFERRDVDLVDKAVEEMQNVILKMLQESIGDQYYIKSLDCLAALREGCVAEEEPDAFNRFMRKLKGLYGTASSKRKDFWTLIKDKQISLIHADECAESEVTPSESTAFLTDEYVTTVEPVEETKPDAGDDDLFGELE